MASKAERTRQRRAAAAVRDSAPASMSNLHDSRPKAAPQVVRRETGLDMLLAKGRLTAAQGKAGRLYGMLERTAQITNAAAIRSSLADIGMARGGGGYLFPAGGEDLFAAEWIADCRERLLLARAVLNFNTSKIAVVDLICGRGLHPREITTVQRETEALETVLRVALDDLIEHFRNEGRRREDPA